MSHDSLPPLREVVETFGLAPQKSLGQNFLFDLNLTRKIARSGGSLEGVTVIEIGPGPGGLTRALLLEGAGHVIAIERDARCRPALEQISAHYPGKLTLIEADALKVRLPELIASLCPDGPCRIMANLPYNIGTALLTGWLEDSPWPPAYERMVLMFQREVAERIVATPLQRADYGRLGVLCGWRTQARILFDVPASAFTPPPKVTSSVVELIPRAAPLPCELDALTLLTQMAFGQRRKMLRQSLKGLAYRGHKIDAAQLLTRCAIEPTCRAEEIDIEGFAALARTLEEFALSSQA